MNRTELVQRLKNMPDSGLVYIDDNGGGLLVAANPRIASSEEKLNAGIDPKQNVIVIDAEIGLLGS
jgi:hypothetical protein